MDSKTPNSAQASGFVLVIDNYDSFTYNLVHYIGELGAKTQVVRNDKITIDEIEELADLNSFWPCLPCNDSVLTLPATLSFLSFWA
ncbi:MAG TPA: hypothetical protein ENJ93_08125 [Chloroflexi bacterium]|nr:hypothetical protein [Chloroflexota bacterium]